MCEIFVIGYQNYGFAKSIIVGEIEFLDCEIQLNSFDALIFTSKNAIRALNHNVQKYQEMQKWKEIPAFVIGKGSAEELKKLGGNLALISPNFHGNAFCDFLSQELKGKNTLYLRAKDIVSNLDTRLSLQGINLTSKIVYQSKMANIHSPKPPKDSILLFTAPSAYHFFVQHFGWDQSYQAVALGKTTYNAFDRGIQSFISPLQDIQKSVRHLKLTKDKPKKCFFS